jgi:hypothetical protein
VDSIKNLNVGKVVVDITTWLGKVYIHQYNQGCANKQGQVEGKNNTEAEVLCSGSHEFRYCLRTLV